jgi:D-alanyl-D-alanine carboxypeptidase (penicillin-binding protein 5/6)
VLIVLAVAYGVAAGLRPVPRPSVALRLPRSVVAPGRGTVPWPSTGEAAIALPGLGAVRSSPRSRPVPIASLAKMMTAYLVLRDHPLRPGATGPGIRVSAADVTEYRRDRTAGDSVAAVAAGEVLTERQALEALLVPSADNVADLLARWDAGSLAAFVRRMNAAAGRLGMTATHYADASGLSRHTVSTPGDQLRIAELDMRSPVFASIVDLAEVRLPVAGTVQNYDYEVGHDGFIGIKTGSDGPAAGCWAFAVRRRVAGRTRVLYGVVLGARGPGGYLRPALDAGVALAAAMPATVHRATILPAGAVVGQLTAAWSGRRVSIVTARAIRGLVAAGARVPLRTRLNRMPRGGLAAGATAGALTAPGVVGTASTALVVRQAVAGPSIGWRLARLP